LAPPSSAPLADRAAPADDDDRAPRWLAGALVGAAALAYALTAARHVLGGDNGEFATLYARGGVAHPTGYPLYVLYLRALHWLPAASPAHGAALATALLGVATTLVLHAACRAFGASRGAAAIVVAAHAFSAHAWIASTHAEVFALNALIAAAISWLAAQERWRGVARVVALGAVAGLGLANHASVVLLAPIGLWGAVRGARESGRAAAATLAGLLALVVGLSPYAYLVWAARVPDGHVLWGETGNLRGLVRHMLRSEYGSTTLTLGAHRPERLAQELLLARSLIVGLVGLPVVALVGALVRALAGAPVRTLALPLPAARSRGATAALAASFALAGPGFVALFNISAHGLDRLIVERFHLLPQIVACVWLAPALDVLLSRLRARPLFASALAGATALGSAGLSLEAVRAHHAPDVERYVLDTLAAAPPDAILLGAGDHRFGGFLYAQRALGLRPDVVYLDVYLVSAPWYRARVGAQLGLELVAPRAGNLSTPELAAQLLATGRPTLLTHRFSDAIPRAFPTYPIGTLERVVATPAEVPDPSTLERMNQAAFAQMHPSVTPAPEGTWGGDLQHGYARPWLALATAFRARGELAHAERLEAIGRSFSATAP
jgi:hypothetical protein